MKKSIKRRIVAVLAVCALMAFAACGNTTPTTDYVYFQNDTSNKMDGVYLTPSSNDQWGDKLNYSSVSAGGKIHMDVKCLTEGSGAEYDFGTIDENGLNFEIYNVKINAGDTLAVSGDSTKATITVTAIDGTVTSYDAYTYYNSDVQSDGE